MKWLLLFALLALAALPFYASSRPTDINQVNMGGPTVRGGTTVRILNVIALPAPNNTAPTNAPPNPDAYSAAQIGQASAASFQPTDIPEALRGLIGGQRILVNLDKDRVGCLTTSSTRMELFVAKDCESKTMTMTVSRPALRTMVSQMYGGADPLKTVMTQYRAGGIQMQAEDLAGQVKLFFFNLAAFISGLIGA
ncbi:Uncharacterised protein [Candidatus Gugararchaeum adminiculabundum]|nr:Uncharacterised protein [Candidatus Gugararchaeum adminiculabundum]